MSSFTDTVSACLAGDRSERDPKPDRGGGRAAGGPVHGRGRPDSASVSAQGAAEPVGEPHH
jgi:hypothetical protein